MQIPWNSKVQNILQDSITLHPQMLSIAFDHILDKDGCTALPPIQFKEYYLSNLALSGNTYQQMFVS